MKAKPSQELFRLSFTLLCFLIAWAAKAQDQTINGSLTIGPQHDETGYGKSLNFNGNTDNFWFNRYNIATNKSELRLNVSDDLVEHDKFVIGTTSSVNNLWYPHLTVQANGNVGIGTSSPGLALDIGGLIQISGINSSSPPEGLSYGLFPYDGVGLGIFTGAHDSNQGMGFWTNFNSEKKEVMRISSDGRVGIGTTSPDARLSVAGKIHSQEVKVSVDAGADFVFAKNYELLPLQELAEFIKKNNHLPEISPADAMKKKGIELGEMNIKLLQKIEELTLHLINKDREVKQLAERVAVLEKDKK